MMLLNRKKERGSLMVEAIAVIALLGLMGTILYRQVRQRNDELDNINMASEIRVVKEATMAYIQSNKSMLEANSGISPGGCVDGEENDCYGYYDNPVILNEIDGYMPDNWSGGIINSYRIGVICYVIVPGENRTACYGVIVPNSPDDPNGSPMPADFTLRRAARVANLIGADGGVYADGQLNGTQGTWSLEDCPGDLCDGRTDPFYVATTGVDVYVPEVDAPDNMALIPDSLALTRLHSTDYFSVGSGDQNCVTNYDSSNGYKHKNVEAGMVVDDEIAAVGSGSCDPLFWVGTAGGESDSSEPGQVYVKNSLFVGRDNARDTQAVAIEAGDTDQKRQLTVYSADGKERVTLNGAGQIVGRSAGGKGYKLDADTGSVVLYEVKNISGIGDVEVPTLRLRGTRLESGKTGEYIDDDNHKVTDVYNVNPEGTSFMGDIRLASRGGAKLSEILPKYSLMNIKSMRTDSSTFETVDKPSCPAGYVRAITVEPVSTEPMVDEVTLELEGTIPISISGENITVNFGSETNKYKSVYSKSGSGWTKKSEEGVRSGTFHGQVTVNQNNQIAIDIITDSDDSEKWKVELYYENDDASRTLTKKYPIVARLNTYCVYDASNFDGSNEAIAAQSTTGFVHDAGTKVKTTIPTEVSSSVSCSEDVDCLNTEYCTGLPNVCTLKGGCTADSGNWKCVDGIFVYAECGPEKACPEGKYCHNNRCKNSSEPSALSSARPLYNTIPNP